VPGWAASCQQCSPTQGEQSLWLLQVTLLLNWADLHLVSSVELLLLGWVQCFMRVQVTGCKLRTASLVV
jgi:hypothetical protein